jgi:hypothetical protein
MAKNKSIFDFDRKKEQQIENLARCKKQDAKFWLEWEPTQSPFKGKHSTAKWDVKLRNLIYGQKSKSLHG